jgi:hypothetical protein
LEPPFLWERELVPRADRSAYLSDCQQIHRLDQLQALMKPYPRDIEEHQASEPGRPAATLRIREYDKAARWRYYLRDH